MPHHSIRRSTMHSHIRSRASNARAPIWKKTLWPTALAPALGVCGMASAAPTHLPAINQPASSEHLTGKVVLVELVTPDLDSSKRFYSSLFGWTYKDSQVGKLQYAEAMLDGRVVG